MGEMYESVHRTFSNHACMHFTITVLLEPPHILFISVHTEACVVIVDLKGINVDVNSHLGL